MGVGKSGESDKPKGILGKMQRAPISVSKLQGCIPVSHLE